MFNPTRRHGRTGTLLSGICLILASLAMPSHHAFAAEGAGKYLKRANAWFAGPEARQIADNILSHQSGLGGWPKNVDTTAAKFTGNPQTLKPTFDNGATTHELRFLARIYAATKADRDRQAFERGLDYILKAQYPTGGWPQFYPPSKQYHRHITFNDGAMVRLLEFLRETYTSPMYGFVPQDRRDAARQAFDRGIECILKCQIRVDGKLTAWCAQHDEKDLRPRAARTYELASLSGAESVGIVRLLMSLDPPSPAVVQAIEGAVAWFEAAQLKGMRVVVEDDPKSPTGKNKVVRDDPAAPPLWARFYEIGTNRPIYADRDGLPKHKLADIGYERRNGYTWLGSWPQKLLEEEYPAWRRSARTTSRTSRASPSRSSPSASPAPTSSTSSTSATRSSSASKTATSSTARCGRRCPSMTSPAPATTPPRAATTPATWSSTPASTSGALYFWLCFQDEDHAHAFLSILAHDGPCCGDPGEED